MNALITSIGREEEYRDSLVSSLHDQKLSGKESIKQLEKMIEKGSQ